VHRHVGFGTNDLRSLQGVNEPLMTLRMATDLAFSAVAAAGSSKNIARRPAKASWTVCLE
jgi:hypothetical protein